MGVQTLPLSRSDGNKGTAFAELYHSQNFLDNLKIAFMKLVTLKLVILRLSMLMK
jgi:hypothetical protein